jgi:hypothetical protein
VVRRGLAKVAATIAAASIVGTGVSSSDRWSHFAATRLKR